MTGARIFVAVVFLLLGASFVASTGAAAAASSSSSTGSRCWSPTATCSSSFRCSAFWRWPPSICRPSSSRTSIGTTSAYGKLRFLFGAGRGGGCRPTGSPSISTSRRARSGRSTPAALLADKGDRAAAGACRSSRRWPTCARRRRARVGLSELRPHLRDRSRCSRCPRRCRRSATASRPRRFSTARRAVPCRRASPRP